MEPVDRDQIRQWVAAQTSLLDPPANFEPDAAAALARFHTRQSAALQSPGWRWWTFAISAAILAGLAIGFLYPAGKLAAQYLLQVLKVGRVGIIQVRPWPAGAPSPSIHALGLRIPPLPARDAAGAAARVHYAPRLPHAFVLTGDPRLYTTFSYAAGTEVRVADLALALEKSGITGITVPPQWDGAQLALHTSGLVIAEWPNAVLIQSLPLTLTAPSGFDFPAYSALILRILGVNPDDARRLADRAGATPPWLAPFASAGGFDRYHRMTLEDISLNNHATATLLTDKREDGSINRIGLFWSDSDRVYLLSGTLDRDLAVSVANAVQ